MAPLGIRGNFLRQHRLAAVPVRRSRPARGGGDSRTRRFTIILVSHRTGGGHRFTVGERTLAATFVVLLALPILVGFGARRSTRVELAQLRDTARGLEAENASYRAATAELASQIESLHAVVNELGVRADAAGNSRALERLSELTRLRAAGGGSSALRDRGELRTLSSALGSPDDTFSVLRDLLGVLKNRLVLVEGTVQRREALLAATPSIWPTHGWLSDAFGTRRDPFTGDSDFHKGLDISTDAGRPVFATAGGTVTSAAYSGAYGNLVIIDHGFGVTTRYGHLGRFVVRPGTRVRRGDVIGYVGSTGRATGSHLHYEVVFNGRFINPLRLLTDPRP